MPVRMEGERARAHASDKAHFDDHKSAHTYKKKLPSTQISNELNIIFHRIENASSEVEEEGVETKWPWRPSRHQLLRLFSKWIQKRLWR